MWKFWNQNITQIMHIYYFTNPILKLDKRKTNLHFHHSFYPLEIQTYKMLNKTVSKNQFEIYKSFIVRNISTHISYFSMSIISFLNSIKKFRSFNLCQIIECLHLTFHWVWYFQELFFTSATFHLMQFNLPTFYTDWKKISIYA